MCVYVQTPKCECLCHACLCACVFSCIEPQEAIICHFKVLTHNPRSVDSFALETHRKREREGGEKRRARKRRGSETDKMRKTLTMCNTVCSQVCDRVCVCVWRSKLTWLIFLTAYFASLPPLPLSLSSILSLFSSLHLFFFFLRSREEISLRDAQIHTHWCMHTHNHSHTWPTHLYSRTCMCARSHIPLNHTQTLRFMHKTHFWDGNRDAQICKWSTHTHAQKNTQMNA